MKHITGQGNTRTISAYFSPKPKGSDGCSLAGPRRQGSPFQPTPTAAPPFPNPPSRRMLALQSPETYSTGRPGPRQPSQPQQDQASPHTKRRAKRGRPKGSLNTRTDDRLNQATQINKEPASKTHSGSRSGEPLSVKICHEHQNSTSLNGKQSHMSLKRHRCPQEGHSGQRTAKRQCSWSTAPPAEHKSNGNAVQTDSRTKVSKRGRPKSRLTSLTAQKHHAPVTVTTSRSSCPTVSTGSHHRTNLEATDALVPPSCKVLDPKMFLAMVNLERLDLEGDPTALKIGTSTSGDIASTSEDIATSSDHSGQLTPSDSPTLRADKEDPLDLELDLDLGLELNLDLAQSIKSSDDEPLISFREMMERSAKPPETPVKGSFSEPLSPTLSSPQVTPLPQLPKRRPGVYKNSLDRMLLEMEDNKRSRETKKKLLHTFEKDLLRITELDDSGESNDDDLLPEQKEFLQSYSLVQNLLRDVHPGEVVFNKEHQGHLFSQDTLLLLGQAQEVKAQEVKAQEVKAQEVKAQDRAQNTFPWSSPAQFRLQVISGFLEESYSSSPCPQHVTCFLFRMMSVHRDRMISEQIFAALKTIGCAARHQMATSEGRQREVWLPSVADVTQVLMNMGVPYVTLFPLESFQPAFTEGDLLKDTQIDTMSPSTHTEPTAFPEHNFNLVLKYMADCLELSPLAYSDPELLLLLTMTSVLGLDAQLCLRPSEDLRSLQHRILSNIRDWDATLPRLCLALTDLTAEHHNMCWLVQLLPDSKRGVQLRKHLSLCLISKLLNGSCTYTPTQTDFQLSDLQPYLVLMRPSSLRRLLISSSRHKAEESFNTLDHEAYYLCFSLLTLVNEASNVQSIQPHQREQLLALSSVLERRIKNDIRESEKCLYRTKVKDFVTRIYIKWEKLILRTRYLQKTLYHYFTPSAEEPVSGSQMVKEAEEDEDQEAHSVTEHREEEEGGDAEAMWRRKHRRKAFYSCEDTDMSGEESDGMSMDTGPDGEG